MSVKDVELDPVLARHLNPDEPFDKQMLDMITKGLVRYYEDQSTGELMLSLTEKGKQVAQSMGGEEVNDKYENN